MEKIINENRKANRNTQSSPDSVIEAAIAATGKSPKVVKMPLTQKADDFVGKSHEGVEDAVAKYCAATEVKPVKSVPITADAYNDVDASDKDYREVVEVRPHMIPSKIGKHQTRYAKKRRGQSPGSYRGGKDMAKYGELPPWANLQTDCQAPRYDGKPGTCTRKSRKGSKFCKVATCQPYKHGMPDYADDPAFSVAKQNSETADHIEDEGPLPEGLRTSLLWVWGNFYTPFSWMVIWVFSVMMSAKGVFGQAIASPRLLMRYCTHGVACKWKWKQTIAILSQAMARNTPLLSVSNVQQVLGSHQQIRDTHVVKDSQLSARVAKGVASQDTKGKWTGRNGAKWYKEAAKKWDSIINTRWEENCIKAYLDPEGLNSRCTGLAELIKEDGTPNATAAKRKYKGQLITLAEIRKGSRKIPAFFSTTLYKYSITKATKVEIFIAGNSNIFTKQDFVTKYVETKAKQFAGKYDVFYLVNEKASKPRGSKKGLNWINDPVIIQCAVYTEGDEAKLFLGVGRKTNTGGYDGPFESLFLRVRRRSQFTHVWDADDELDVMELLPKAASKKVAEDGLITSLNEGQTLTMDDLIVLQV